MVKTTVMEAVLTEAETKVVIHRHPTDFHTLSEDVGRRVVSTLEKTPAGCLYFNPAVTVACSTPTENFFEAVRREQARWCRQASRTFPRSARRRVSRWVGGGEWTSHRFARYLDRGLCFTGVLFIDGEITAFTRLAGSRDGQVAAEGRQES